MDDSTDSGGLRCPNCGKQAASWFIIDDATYCGYCKPKEMTVVCPECERLKRQIVIEKQKTEHRVFEQLKAELALERRKVKEAVKAITNLEHLYMTGRKRTKVAEHSENFWNDELTRRAGKGE